VWPEANSLLAASSPLPQLHAAVAPLARSCSSCKLRSYESKRLVGKSRLKLPGNENTSSLFSHHRVQSSSLIVVYARPDFPLPPRRQQTEETMGGKLRFVYCIQYRCISFFCEHFVTLHSSAHWLPLNPKLVTPPPWDAVHQQQPPDPRAQCCQVCLPTNSRNRSARCYSKLTGCIAVLSNTTSTPRSDSLNSGDGQPPSSPSSTAVVTRANSSTSLSPFFTTVAFASDMGSRLIQKVSIA